MRINRYIAGVLGLAFNGFATFSPVHAQVTVAIPASKDNTLFESTTGGVSNGAGDYLFAGNTNSGASRRTLLAFDLASHIPAGAVIESAMLTLNMSKTISGAQRVAVHRVLADWGEGTSDATGEEGSGTNATPSDATWLHTFFDSQFWMNPGGDFSSTASAAIDIDANGSYTWGSTPEMVNNVQGWLGAPESNFGWVLVGNETVNGSSKRFDSRQNPETTNQPLLKVVYSVSTGVTDASEAVPSQFALAQNYPNPFNPTTTIRYALPRTTEVKLVIYDISGKPVRTLVDGVEAAGIKSLTWDGTEAGGAPAATGVYFYRLTAGPFTAVRKLTLLR